MPIKAAILIFATGSEIWRDFIECSQAIKAAKAAAKLGKDEAESKLLNFAA